MAISKYLRIAVLFLLVNHIAGFLNPNLMLNFNGRRQAGIPILPEITTTTTAKGVKRAADSVVRSGLKWKDVAAMKNDVMSQQTATGGNALGKLLATGNEKQVANYLKDYLAKEKERREKACNDQLGTSICKNFNAQPFYIWTQMAARNIVGDPLADLEKMVVRDNNGAAGVRRVRN